MKTRSPLFALSIAAGLLAAHSQDLTESLTRLTGDAAKQYVSPMVSGFGADLNAGWYHKAPSADKFKFSIETGLIVMGTLLGDGKKTFDVQSSFRLTKSQADSLVQFVEQDPNFAIMLPAERQRMRDSLSAHLMALDNHVRFHGPTIIGSSKDSVKFNYSGGKVATGLSGPIYPDSVDIPSDSIALITGLLAKLPVLPLLAPQFAIGTVFGTNLSLRWLPSYDIPKIGNFKYFGFGIQHNPSVWFGGKMPVDLCVGYFHQNLELGSLFEAQSNALGVNVSKTLGWRLLNVTPYAGFQLEKATMEFHYDFELDPNSTTVKTIPIKFELEGDNHTRLTLGLSVHLLILNINADYNVAKYPSISAGLMFGI